MKTPLLLAALATFSVAALAGCDTMRGTPSPRVDPQPAQSYPKVAVPDPALARSLGVNPQTVVQTSGSETPLTVVVPVRSLVDNVMRVQYRWLWFDAMGRQVGQTTWANESLGPRLEVRFQGNATTLDARDWRLEIRSAR